MADALVSTVLQQLSFILEQEVRLVVGVTRDLKKLSSTFTKVQAVIEDAEEKQVNNKPVMLWLEDLKDVAYDMDDLLDEWRTKIILKSQKEERVNAVPIYLMKKVCPTTCLLSPCFCFKQLVFLHKIGSRIKEIKERLDDIATDKDRYQLTQTSSSSERRTGESRTPQTSSLVDVSEIFGRDLDKDVIISKPVSESSQAAEIMDSPVSIISIVGMGGIDKTTLAQLAYNDEKVRSHFQKRMWVCVSEPFDKVRIAKEIIRAVGSENVVDADGTSWDALHGQLSKSIDGKHFLLVLDDVWTEDYREWQPLKLSLSCGANGSRIVITTRNLRVAIMMGTTYTHSLGTLSDADCWSLLSRIAFAGRREEECVELGLKNFQVRSLLKLPEGIGRLVNMRNLDDDDDGDEDRIFDDDDGDGDGDSDGDGNVDNDDNDGGKTPKRMEDVLENLQPHPNLQKLQIHDYLGTKFPNWMARDDDSMLLSNLIYLELMDWKQCKQLPPVLGKLPSLEKLRIDGMHIVKNMGCDFFGIDGGGAAMSDGTVKTVFPKLKALQISRMFNLKEWNMSVREEDGREIKFNAESPLSGYC